NWQGLYGGIRQAKNTSREFINATLRRGRFMSRLNLQQGNNSRQQEKEQALDVLVTMVRPIWENLRSRPGRSPGRSLLLQYAKAAGISLSERQAREVLKRLIDE